MDPSDTLLHAAPAVPQTDGAAFDPAGASTPEVTRWLAATRTGGGRRRLIEGFLGGQTTHAQTLSWTPLRAALAWAVLPGHLAAAGYRVHGCLDVSGTGRVGGPPRLRAVERSAADGLLVPERALILAAGQAGRLALRFGMERYACCPAVACHARATAPLAAFLAGWEARVRTHHPLRGRPILPDGTRVGSGPPPCWDDVVLADDVKAEIRRQVEFLLAHGAVLRERLGIRRRRGLILSGPPGTGKTLIGRVLAATLRETFIWVTPAHLGDSDDVRRVLDLARLVAPTVLFLEDIDVHAEDRHSSRDAVALGELMNQLDGCVGDHAIVTIATTNRPDVLEEAIRNRPGRFDRVITIPPPDAAGRRTMLARRFAGQRVAGEDLDWLVARAEGCTGAQLEELANSALLDAFERAGAATGDGLALPRATLSAALDAIGAGGPPTVGFGTGAPAD